MTLALVLLSAALAADPANGSRIYVANCQACHGRRADGKGPAAAQLRPPPVDFTRREWWKGRTDAKVKAAIRAGRPGTAMMGFPNLSDDELDDLVAWLREAPDRAGK